jgi:hypothetical protein
MASQKVRPPALQRLFKTSTYNMYVFTLEQPLRLGVRNFYLAILVVFTRSAKLKQENAERVRYTVAQAGMTLIVLLKE